VSPRAWFFGLLFAASLWALIGWLVFLFLLAWGTL
jgi:hypothetical protein